MQIMKRKWIRFAALCLAVLLSFSGCSGKKASEGKRECVAIIAALEFEVELIHDKLEDPVETELLSTPTWEGKIGQYDVVVMQCGMGKVSAGIGTQALIDYYHPDYVINTGCAGALSPSLRIGDIVLSESVVEWDLDLRTIGYPLGYIDALDTVEMKASSVLCDRLESIIVGDELVVRGMVASGDQFVSTEEQRKIIRDNFPGALCAEMEGAAVGHVCVQNKTPFCIIRSMSDTADGNSGVNYAEFSVEASKKSAAWLIELLHEKKPLSESF